MTLTKFITLKSVCGILICLLLGDPKSKLFWAWEERRNAIQETYVGGWPMCDLSDIENVTLYLRNRTLAARAYLNRNAGPLRILCIYLEK